VLPLWINNARLEELLLTKLSILLRGYPGRVRVYLPRLQTDGDIEQLLEGGRLTEDDGAFGDWARNHIQMIEDNLGSDRPFDPDWSKERIVDIRLAMESGLAIEAEDRRGLGLDRIILEPDQHHTVFLMFDRPARRREGQYFDIDVQQLDSARDNELIGGITARVELVPEPNQRRRRVEVDLTLSEIEFINQLAVESRSDFSGAIGRLVGLLESHPRVDDALLRRPRGKDEEHSALS
jgi:hypothetical protein